MKAVVQTPWTDEERAMLRRLRANGVGRVQIAVMMGRSKNSVSRQMQYLGLGVRNAPRPAKPPKPRHEGPQRAGATTLPPLPSLSECVHAVPLSEDCPHCIAANKEAHKRLVRAGTTLPSLRTD